MGTRKMGMYRTENQIILLLFPINNLFLENQFISNKHQGFSSFEVRKKIKQYSSKFVT
jgi:hypothetical protein